jgi:hypothetical protein
MPFPLGKYIGVVSVDLAEEVSSVVVSINLIHTT